jgi:hypothetical protein
MTTFKNSPEQDPAVAEWDSESRSSAYCTVWAPVQDDEDEWQAAYDNARSMGMDDLAATEYADAKYL